MRVSNDVSLPAGKRPIYKQKNSFESMTSIKPKSETYMLPDINADDRNMSWWNKRKPINNCHKKLENTTYTIMDPG